MMNTLNKLMEKLNKAYAVFADNTYLNALQNAILTLIPLILVGSLITILDIVEGFVPGFPDLSMISTFSMGMLGLGTAFLIAYQVMETQHFHDRTLITAVVSAAVFLYLIEPQFVDGGILFNTSRLGAAGMIAAIIVGFGVSLIMSFSAKHHFFKEDSVLPDFIKVWFETILPILFTLLIVYVLQNVLHFSIYGFIEGIFAPLGNVYQTFWGFLLIQFLMVFFYAFGISPWFLQAIVLPLQLAAIEANSVAVAAGEVALNLGTKEFTNSYLTIGGLGQTLPLVILLAFFARSQRLKTMGKVCLAPAVLNINEPVVYGAPIMLNPLLMVPFWLSSVVSTMIAWGAVRIGFVPVPSSVYQLWYTPQPFMTFLAGGRSINSVLLVVILFAVCLCIYYPFFRAYDKQQLTEENGEKSNE